MTWSESEHPRDEDGKFTFKGSDGKSSKTESPAEILYGKKKREEKKEKDLRNSLLDKLGNSLEAKHILFSSVDKLKK